MVDGSTQRSARHAARMATGMDLLMTAFLVGCCLLVLMRSPSAQPSTAAGAVQMPPQPGQRCDYGQQPHYFLQDHANATNTTVGRWGYHAWDERCEPDNVVEYLADGGGPRLKAGAAGDGKLRMLLLGHSIDRKMVEGFCELADVPVVGLRSPAEWWNTSVCDTPGLLMMHVWNQGVHSGQIARGGKQKDVYLKDGIRTYRSVGGGAPPDIILFGSGYWDLAWQLGEPERPFFDTHASEDLGAYLHEYRRDLLSYVGTVREAFPDTRFFALRTDSHIRVAPRRDEPKRWSWLNHPNTNAYISQMNDVLRHVAASEGLPLVDFERIAMQLPQGSALLEDGYHLKPSLLGDVMLNLLLNAFFTRALE